MIRVFVKNGCDVCKLAVRRFKKWQLDFTIENIDESIEALADYCFYYNPKIEPEVPLILIDDVGYAKKEAYELLKPKSKKHKEKGQD